MRNILILILCYLPECLFAQGFNIHWSLQNNLNDSLPSSIKIYYTQDSLHGRPFRAYYAHVSLDKHIIAQVQTHDGHRLRPIDYFKNSNKKSYVIINGAFFSYETQHNVDLAISDGKLIDPNQNIDTIFNQDSVKIPIYKTGGAFGITAKGKPDIVWTYNFNGKVFAFNVPNSPVNGIWIPPIRHNGYRWNVKQAIGGGPVLLPYISSVQENRFSGEETDLHPRTAIGYTCDGSIILLVVEGRHPGKAMGANLLELAWILKQLHCVEALNLDGGGSTCMLVNGKETITPSDKDGERPVPSIFLIREP